MNQKTSKLLRKAAANGIPAPSKKDWHSAHPRRRGEWRLKMKDALS